MSEPWALPGLEAVSEDEGGGAAASAGGSGPGQTMAPHALLTWLTPRSWGFREADHAVSLRLDVPLTELVQRLQNVSVSP